MQIELVIEAIRQRCSLFSNRVAGAAQLNMLPETTAFPVPCAFVVPMDDEPTDSRSQNSVRQGLVESFAVVVAISNTDDERGQSASAHVIEVRAVLWAALLGWRVTENHDGIVYEGGSLIAIDRARLWYQFEFSAETEIGPEDGWQETELAGLPHFDGVTVTFDAIDPADPNIANPGPDGRAESVFSVPKSGALD